jgi:hypothetical protein
MATVHKEDDGPSMEEKIAAGHMLTNVELQGMYSGLIEELSCKLVDGHLLSDGEIDQLKHATATTAKMTVDTLSTKLDEGHLLSDSELEQLREASVTSASIEADALTSKLATGYMLSDDELTQLKEVSLTSATLTADMLASKLEEGHMLSDDELEQLKHTATLAKSYGGTTGRRHQRGSERKPVPPHAPRTSSRNGGSLSSSVRQRRRSSRKSQQQWVDGGPSMWSLDPSPSASRLPGHLPVEIYSQADEARKKASAGRGTSVGALINDASRNIQPFLRSASQTHTSSKSALPNSAEWRPLYPLRGGERHTERAQSAVGSSRGELHIEVQSLGSRSVLRSCSRQRNASATGGRGPSSRPSTAIELIPVAPAAPRSTRAAPRTSRRQGSLESAVTASHGSGSGGLMPLTRHHPRYADDALIAKVTSGQLLSPSELKELRAQVDVDAAAGEADNIAARLQAGHLLTEEEIRVLQFAVGSEGVQQPRILQAIPNITSAPSSRTPKGSSSRSGGLKASRQHQQALAELQLSAMVLLSDGVDVGDLRVSELLDLKPAGLNPLRIVGRKNGGGGPTPLQRKASSQLQLLSAYREQQLQSLPAIQPHPRSSSSRRSRRQ